MIAQDATTPTPTPTATHRGWTTPYYGVMHLLEVPKQIGQVTVCNYGSFATGFATRVGGGETLAEWQGALSEVIAEAEAFVAQWGGH